MPLTHFKTCFFSALLACSVSMLAQPTPAQAAGKSTDLVEAVMNKTMNSLQAHAVVIQIYSHQKLLNLSKSTKGTYSPELMNKHFWPDIEEKLADGIEGFHPLTGGKDGTFFRQKLGTADTVTVKGLNETMIVMPVTLYSKPRESSQITFYLKTKESDGPLKIHNIRATSKDGKNLWDLREKLNLEPYPLQN